MSLLDYAANEFSQNGEDGVIRKIFDVVGERTRFCCEFGAWDGIHLSNTRALILRGWAAVLIEADASKFRLLEENYRARPDIRCVHATVGRDASLAELLRGAPRLDFLSIDIDGRDYEVMADLGVMPRLICVEVNAGHNPASNGLLPPDVAASNVGQPLGEFVRLGDVLGYRLIAYTGNAFFLHSDVAHEEQLPTLTPREAYEQFLSWLPYEGREWLYCVNRGWVAPHHRFHNPYLRAPKLGISMTRSVRLHLRQYLRRTSL